jgi:hypothetical protein
MKIRDYILASIVAGMAISSIGPAAANSTAGRHVIGGAGMVGTIGNSGASSRHQPRGGISGSAKFNSRGGGSYIRTNH